MSSGTGSGTGGEAGRGDGSAAAERADGIMAGLSALVDAGDPDVLDALRTGQAELEELTARFAGEYWLLPVLLHYRGVIHQELWDRISESADLDAAFELQLRAAESTPDPDEAVVFALLTAAWDRHAQAPSSRAREAFISWGTRTLARLAADPDTPPRDEDVLQLRLQLALALRDRAGAGPGGSLADLDMACDLLVDALDSMPEPDEDVVSGLIGVLGERLAGAPSRRHRDMLITWGSWLLARPPAEPEQPGEPFDDDVLRLREQVALALNERADEAGEQAGPGDAGRLTDLAAAIGHYEAALAARPAGDPERAEFLAFTVQAYWDLIDAGGSRDKLVDQMTWHAREAWTAPGLPEEIRPNVGLFLGLGLLEQFSRPGPRPDITLVDLGAGALAEVLPELREEPDLGLLAEAALGLFLTSKGQLSGDAANLAEAEPHLERAVRAMNARPADDPVRAVVVRWLAAAEAALAASGLRVAHSDLAARLLEADAEHPYADPEQAAMADMALGTVLYTRAAGQRGPDMDEGIAYLVSAFQKAPADSALRLAIARNLCSALAGRFFTVGNRQDLQAAQYYLEVLDQGEPEALSGAVADTHPDADVVIAATRGQIALTRGITDRDPVAVRAGVEHLRAAARLAGPRHPLAGRLRSDLGLALFLRFTAAGEDPADLRESMTELEAGAGLLPAGHAMRDIALFRAASALSLLGSVTRDPRVIRESISRMRRVRADWGGGPGDPVRVTAMLAVMHSELWGLTGDPADLAAARDWYTTAAAEFDREPGHPRHGMLLIGLARLERRAGAGQAAVEAGLAALRAWARDVLLQSGPAHGLATARTAADGAVEIARWCLDDGAGAQAIEALELGRGLVLHAVTSAADLPEMLDAAGREDLASEWRVLAGQPVTDAPWDLVGHGRPGDVLGGETLAVPDDLRERTLGVLGADLVTPPVPGEIAAALSRAGADALVYLLPSADAGQVRALLVPAHGGPRTVPLPPAASTPLDEFAAAQASLLAAVPGTSGYETADSDWRDKLGPLCDWAWTSVIGPLLAEMPRAAPGTAPRLVLVPAGLLGVVPWHAARRAGPDSGWRYAVADAVFSYAASGRQLAEVSRRPVLPLAADPVIVAPENDLKSGPVEAAAIRGLYPGARCLGLALPDQEDSPATPAAVLGVLPAMTTAGASMLHLVCHGMATSAGADASFLELEPATGEIEGPASVKPDRLLTVRAILRQAGGRPAAAPGGIVTLAACRTDVTATDHDEALTLSTAFLAAGAVTVVGSRWDLLDAHNAVLMYMFHHYLGVAGQRPAEALRSAQLWMLDPDREPPSSMPADLRDRWGLDHVLAWAGLTHQGQ